MSGFKDMVAADIKNVFMNKNEFAELHTVLYDGAAYADIPVVLTRVKEEERRQLVSDHVQGLYLATAVMHCAAADLGGVMPEKGMRIKINDEDFFREYYVASSGCNMGMLRIELEAIDE